MHRYTVLILTAFIWSLVARYRRNIYSTQTVKLAMLEADVLSLAKQYLWQLEAWAVFVNHYHLIVRSICAGPALDKFLKHLHSNTARKLNALDGSAGLEVWFNFWDKKLTYERSYLARLNYVHQNR